MTLKNICVYCGSNPGARPDYLEQARVLARELVKRDLGLVYGGSIVGIMGVIANEVLAGGGRVIGVIPELLQKKEQAHRGLTELHLVQSMHERKAMMMEKADGFIALPGGAGTLEEFFEVWTWAQLSMHQKPCGLLNIAGYYDALMQFVDHAVDEAFMRPQHRDMLVVESDPATLLDRYAIYEPPNVSKWFEPVKPEHRAPNPPQGKPAMSNGSSFPASTESVLRDYFHAKDENRPHYMARAFAPQAVLKMALRTQAIAFPPESHGLAAITDTLVRKFGQTYDNVYTFYLARPDADARLSDYSCDWIVGMTEKATGNVRVGCGRYDWTFQPEPYRASRLTITIETMVTLPPGDADAVFGWLLALDYPWTNAQRVVAGAPPLEDLAPVVQYLLHPM